MYWWWQDSTSIEAYCEVRNNTSQGVYNVEVLLTVRNAEGTLIATATGMSLISVLLPGQSSPVVFYFDVPGGGETLRSAIVNLNVRDTWWHTPTNLQDSFQLTSHSSFVDSYGSRHVVGEAQNIVSVRKDLKAIVWVRGRGDYQDLIMAAGSAYVSSVGPGARVPFEVVFYKRFGDFYDHYEIVLETY